MNQYLRNNYKTFYLPLLLITQLFSVLPVTGQLSATQYTGASNSQTFIGNYDDLNNINLDGTSELTVTLWVKWDNKSAGGPWGNMFTLNRTTGSGDNGIFWFQHNNSNTRFEFAAQASSRRFTQSTTNPIDGQWYHLTGVYDGNEIRIYVDGVLENTNTDISGSLVYYTEMALYFGRWARDNARNFSGCIAEASLWGRVLTDTEIQNMMYNHLAVTGASYNATGLFGYWDLNDFTSPVDLTGNNNGVNNLVIDCAENPLPVELISFDVANIENKKVAVHWTTASERNNDFFTVERSNNGIEFEELAMVSGAGNSIEEIDYEWIDVAPFSGISYYRLKQTDFDGSYRYSATSSVRISDEQISVYPNPVKSGSSLTIQHGIANSSDLSYTILNIAGKVVDVDSIESETITCNLPPGIYLLKITSGSTVYTQKIIIQ